MDRLDTKRMQVLEALGDVGGMDVQGGLTVGQVMTSVPSCVPPDTTALELIRLLHTKQFRHLTVLDADGCLIGVVSDRDVIRCLGPDKHPDRASLERITARDIMSTDLVTVGPNTALERAVVLMIEQGISSLPVLADGALAGILTNTDLHVVLQVLLQTVRRSSPEQSRGSTVSSPQI